MSRLSHRHPGLVPGSTVPHRQGWKCGGCLSPHSGSRHFGRDDDEEEEEEEGGFSLIEALVALAVLAIASVGLMRTVQAHIDSTRGLELRATAMWVAENRLAEIGMGGPIAADQQTEMLGQNWRVRVSATRTDDPEILKVRIRVFGGETSPLASLDGFADAGPG